MSQVQVAIALSSPCQILSLPGPSKLNLQACRSEAEASLARIMRERCGFG